MAEPDPAPAAPFARPLARLRARLWLVMGIGAVLFGLVPLGGLAWPWALIGLGLLVILAALVPDRFARGLPEEGESASSLATEGITVLADALADPCFVLDRRNVVLHRNAAAAERFPGVVPGRPLTFSLRNPELVRAIEHAAASAAAETVELHETLPSETWSKMVVAPLRVPGRDWGSDEERLLALTVQDLTELKRVDALRADFVANASHELRTPLTSLLGFIQTLQGPAAEDAAARGKFLSIMAGQAERMARLIEDLLSLSRIEMHQHLRPTGTVDLALLLREVCEGLRNRAGEAGVAIDLALPEGAAPTIGDREQLYEVFENLIENAIKYGADGKTVEVGLGPAGQPGFAHRVSVADHGPGVAEEHVPRLTERFYRVDAESSRRKKGTGLGLAIVKHVVARHHGRLTIRSRPGEGLRVEILLPG